MTGDLPREMGKRGWEADQTVSSSDDELMRAGLEQSNGFQKIKPRLN